MWIEQVLPIVAFSAASFFLGRLIANGKERRSRQAAEDKARRMEASLREAETEIRLARMVQKPPTMIHAAPKVVPRSPTRVPPMTDSRGRSVYSGASTSSGGSAIDMVATMQTIDMVSRTLQSSDGDDQTERMIVPNSNDTIDRTSIPSYDSGSSSSSSSSSSYDSGSSSSYDSGSSSSSSISDSSF
jgi:hypothetical protein